MMDLDHRSTNKWEPWKPGMLVMEKRWTSCGSLAFPGEEVGVILRCYDSNVYEGASVDILIGGTERWVPVKELIRVQDTERQKENE